MDPKPLVRAAKALNVAALLASDCGLPGLAPRLYLQQFDLYYAACPLPAELALQPLINLARLHTRAGDGETSFRLLRTVIAIGEHTTALIDGRSLDLADFAQDGVSNRRKPIRSLTWWFV